MFGQRDCLRRGVNNTDQNHFDCGPGSVSSVEFFDGDWFLKFFIVGKIQWAKDLVYCMQEYALDTALGLITFNQANETIYEDVYVALHRVQWKARITIWGCL